MVEKSEEHGVCLNVKKTVSVVILDNDTISPCKLVEMVNVSNRMTRFVTSARALHSTGAQQMT